MSTKSNAQSNIANTTANNATASNTNTADAERENNAAASVAAASAEAVNNDSTALALPDSGFAVLANANFANAAAEELDGLDGGVERVKMPGAGGVMYEIPGDGEDGEGEMVKELRGVILNHHPMNARYDAAYKGGNQPPDCGSLDGKTGRGVPGGNCATCRYNQYGSDPDGNGKACKNKRRVYILREGDVFPLLLTLPTGSLKPFTKYIKSLLSKGKTSSEVVTKFSLKRAQSSGGIAYSQAVFTVDRALSPEEYALIKPLAEQIKSYARSVDFDNAQGDEADIEVDTATGEIISPLKSRFAEKDDDGPLPF